MGRKRKAGSRILGVFLSFAMAVTMFPTMASANEGTSTQVSTNEGISTQADDDSPIQLSKTATLESDGTYTIQMEAYATGEVVTRVETQTKPTDIILVLDQSGSMDDSMSGLPNGKFTAAGTLSNAEAYAGSYYYRVGTEYYPVTVRYATTGSLEGYQDSKGVAYAVSDISTQWTDSYGITHEADGPYVTSTLKTFTRESRAAGYIYRNDTTREIYGSSIGTSDTADARIAVREAFPDQTAQFINTDSPGYTAAVYNQVVPIYAHTYEYYYTDDGGNLVPIEGIGEGNSKECPISLYVQGSATGSKLGVLKYAVEKFVTGVAADAQANSVMHRIAITGFANEPDAGILGLQKNNDFNTEILTTDSLKGTQGVSPVQDNYSSACSSALQDPTDSTGMTRITNAINALTANGATRADEGMKMAQDILNARSDADGRDAIIVYFTDGEPNSNSGFDNDIAADVINMSRDLKASGVDVYSVAVYDGASPTGDRNINGSGAARINEYMHLVSSNYPESYGEKQAWNRPWEFFRGAGGNNGYYMVADNASALANIFTTITNNIDETTTTVELDDESVLRDILSDSFALPEGYNESQIIVETEDYAGNGEWTNRVTLDQESGEINVDVDSENGIIEVSGFNYKDNYVVDATDTTERRGKRLIVTVPGVEAKAEAATGGLVFTNTSDSGIYDQVTGADKPVLIQAFNRPTVTITNKSYVLDYGKAATFNTSDLGLTNTSHINSDMSKIATNKTALDETLTYGKAVLANSQITYTPQTMNWDGYDSIFAFEKDSTDDTENTNQWARMNVLPANSVYYEDTFETTTDGTVGIEYSDGNWFPTGAAQNNTQTVDDSAYGWEDSYTNDSTYSDGTAHYSETKGATATFTFTGTGVDIYSKTDMKTGIIMATVYEGTSTDNAKMKKILNVDGKAETGGKDGYYQVPTLSLSVNDSDGNPIYGTYTVQLKVRSSSDGRSMYYLDGIRVYNPLQGLEGSDANVDGAYGAADESYAEFKSVRDILVEKSDLTAGGKVTGAVFIDKNSDGTVGDMFGTVQDYKDYGAKNEVYLASGQAIAFEADPSMTYYLGMRAPDGAGSAAAVNITNGDGKIDRTISSASDLYYQITPSSDGYVVVENRGPGMLALTKLRTTGSGEADTQDLFTISDVSALMSYIADFDTLPAEEPSDTEDTGIVIPDDTVDDDVQTGDVVIENPDDGQQSNDSLNNVQNTIRNWIDKIFSSIRSWFM